MDSSGGQKPPQTQLAAAEDVGRVRPAVLHTEASDKGLKTQESEE